MKRLGLKRFGHSGNSAVGQAKDRARKEQHHMKRENKGAH